MFHINVSRLINKPIDYVFMTLSDHANYSAFKGIDGSKVLEPGAHEHNGIGALREIIAGKSVLHERIVVFERPNKIGYLIEQSTPLPYQHELGMINLHTQSDKTLVEWESKGHINIPVLGRFYFDKQIQKYGARAFGSILKQIDMR